MRVSLKWIRRHADLPGGVRELADRLTMAGYVVASTERVETPGGADDVLDVEVTYNRPDLLSHIGVARELAGVVGSVLRIPESAVPPECAIADEVPVEVQAGELCPVYTARVVRGVRVGPSPVWLASALEAVGQRSVNNVVDVTNYVMLEQGQPLHAFDLGKLRGPRIVVRPGRDEKVTAIDGKQLDVRADDLAICDAAGPVALAGVMGGLHTEVGTGTRDVLLESAVFAPLSIRATSRRHNLRSESSYRYERFVDPTGVRNASDRAARLFVDVCGATGVGPIVAGGPGSSAHAATIVLRTDRVAHVLGLDVHVDEIRSILASLGLREGQGAPTGATTWAVPSWRPDLVAEIDLIEEVGRRAGFERVPERNALAIRPRIVDRELDTRRRIREALVRHGLRECVSAPFVSAGLQDVALVVARPALRVVNPMRADENLLRRSLVGQLLATARRNADRGVASVRLFEAAPVYVAGPAEGSTDEIRLVAGVVSGDYSVAKGCVDALLAALGLDGSADFVRGAGKPLRGDRSATVRLDRTEAGVIGELSVNGAQRFGITGPLAIFELRTDVLTRAAPIGRPCVPVSRFPAIERDLAWVVPDGVEWRRIEAAARSAGAPLVSAVRFLSEFRGPTVGPGAKSVAFRVELRANDRTLTSDEADDCTRRIVARLTADTGGAIRT